MNHQRIDQNINVSFMLISTNKASVDNISFGYDYE